MVTAGDHNPTSLTPEERVDQAISEARYGQAGIAALGIGGWMDSGGGTGGQFVFVNLDEIDSILREWEDLRDRIDARRRTTDKVRNLCNPPAGDMMSEYQANAGLETATAKLEHDDALWAYAQAYVDNLTACHKAMTATERGNADRLRGAGEGLGHA